MGASSKSRKVLQVVSGWNAVELILNCVVYGTWQFLKISFKRLWKGHRRKTKNFPPVELTVDTSVGTHCYIKIMGVKYHYVDSGPKYGDPVLVLGDAPNPGLMWSPAWARVMRRLTETGHRVITLDLRGTGGSEGGSRRDLSPPRVVEELFVMLEAFGVSENKPAVVIGHGIGGMLAWYLVHCHAEVISKFVVVDAPHPSLYWQYPPAPFCQNTLHFIQWPSLPESWLASKESNGDGDAPRWANSRACDWTGALNYVRGAAWWRIRAGCKARSPALLVGRGASAAELVASAERCLSPTLRMISHEQELESILMEFLIAKDTSQLDGAGEWRVGIMGRMLGAVAERGRGLSARLLLPPPTPA